MNVIDLYVGAEFLACVSKLINYHKSLTHSAI